MEKFKIFHIFCGISTKKNIIFKFFLIKFKNDQISEKIFYTIYISYLHLMELSPDALEQVVIQLQSSGIQFSITVYIFF